MFFMMKILIQSDLTFLYVIKSMMHLIACYFFHKRKNASGVKFTAGNFTLRSGCPSPATAVLRINATQCIQSQLG